MVVAHIEGIASSPAPRAPRNDSIFLFGWAVWVVLYALCGKIFFKGTMKIKILTTILFVLSITNISTAKQQRPQLTPYFTLPHYDTYLEYIIHNGTFRTDHVLHQPYMCSEIVAGLADSSAGKTDFQDKWQRIITDELSRYYNTNKPNHEDGHWNLGMNGEYRMFLKNGDGFTQHRAELFGTYSLPYFVMANRTVMDQNFKNDPRYYGDLGEWVQGRVQDGYALIGYKRLKFFMGRISRNLGLTNEYSLILSDYPYSYDHFGFELDTRRLHYAFYFTRLNDMVGFNIQVEHTWPLTAKRYFSIQRGELKILNNLHAGLSEVVIYGGENQNFEPAYLNPLNFYYVAQRNQGIQMSGLWAVDALWRPLDRLSIYGQLLIDDIIINNEAGQDDRSVHPNRLGNTLKFTTTNFPLPGSMFSLTWTRVSNWTYMSYRTWENYLYHDKSMGYPENSLDRYQLEATYLGHPPFIGTLQLGYSRHGDQDNRNVFGDTIEKFPRGVVEKTFFADLEVYYLYAYWLRAKLGVRYESANNYRNVSGKSRDNFQVKLTVESSVQKMVDF